MATLMSRDKRILFIFIADPHNISKNHNVKEIYTEYVAPRRTVCGTLSARENVGKGPNR